MLLAQTPREVFGQITPPDELKPLINEGGQGAGGISTFLTSGIFLLFEIALLAVTINLIWGAVSWIISGGDKEALGEAKKRITTSLIGLILLSVVFAVLNLAKEFTGFTFFG